MRTIIFSLTLGIISFFPSFYPLYATEQHIEKKETWKLDKKSLWYPLYSSLKKDGFSDKELQPFFIALENNFSQKPMGNKVKELYTIKFVPKKPQTKEEKKKEQKENKLGIPYPWYPGYVTNENAIKCKNFINENNEFFIKAEKKYNVPKEVLSALMYVETWHGKFLGKYNPLTMLSSMAISKDLSMLPDYTNKLNLTEPQKEWLHSAINKRANWAYEELKALLHYAIKNNIQIQNVPSSIYGAIGYGQFVPSNIPRFGVDGDNDGIIDLFHAPDAIFSIANFLNKSGWKNKNITFQQQVKVLKRYNQSTAYAHTILALAKLTKQEITSEKTKKK